jgi:hypothetical protein
MVMMVVVASYPGSVAGVFTSCGALRDRKASTASPFNKKKLNSRPIINK